MSADDDRYKLIKRLDRACDVLSDVMRDADLDDEGANHLRRHSDSIFGTLHAAADYVRRYPDD